MKKSEVKVGQRVKVLGQIGTYGTVIEHTKATSEVRLVHGAVITIADKFLLLVAQPDWQCPECGCDTTHYRTDSDMDISLECTLCGHMITAASLGTDTRDMLDLVQAPRRHNAITRNALELGNLATLHIELVHEEGNSDYWSGLAADNVDVYKKAKERSEAYGRKQYFEGQAYGFMMARFHVEGLMAELGLEDPWQLRYGKS